MIKEQEIIINGHSSNYIYYRNLGYKVEVRKPFLVKPQDLMKGSQVKITTICDKCQAEAKNVFKDYYNYTNGLTQPYYCSRCKFIKSEVTSMQKWGVKNPMQSEEVRIKLKDSLVEKYGVSHYSKTQEWKNKFKQTSQSKYNTENPFSSQVIKDKIKLSNLQNLGVEYPMQSPNVREKSRNKILDKYGVTHISKSEHIKDPVRKTTYKKYAELLQSEYEILSYSEQVFKMVHRSCRGEFIINRGLVHSRTSQSGIICTLCNPVGNHSSTGEIEVKLFLTQQGIEYTSNNRTVLSGTELDIWIPQYKLAIEFNGLYWHSELFKSDKYHINKTLRCRELDIDLIHIWEDDWKTKSQIIKSIILNRLGRVGNKIGARKCQIGLVDSKTAREFLDSNHIQGYSSSTDKIGLYYGGELVSLMTFGWRRTNNKREYELIRFCNKTGMSVVGSASKLFKYFIKNCTSEIVSYSDISLFSGSIYSLLGFKMVGLSKPNYYWVVEGVKRHRYNFSKGKLVAAGFDSKSTEVEIMHSRGYWRIFSTGQERWVYIIK